jgi:glutathionyl-hydroquinone reductase
MGTVVDGTWVEEGLPETSACGGFQRIESAFRNRVTAYDVSGFKAKAGRYHLYVGYHCPWAHRTILFRALKGL